MTSCSVWVYYPSREKGYIRFAEKTAQMKLAFLERIFGFGRGEQAVLLALILSGGGLLGYHALARVPRPARAGPRHHEVRT